MLKVNVKAVSNIDIVADIMERLQDLTEEHILVGIPEEKSSRPGQNATNAEIAAAHEKGYKILKWDLYQAYVKRFGNIASKQPALAAMKAHCMTKGDPYWNVPPRPFLEPAIEANIDMISTQQGEIIKEALDGVDPNISLNKLGLLAQNLVKGWFTDPRNKWASNHPLVVKLKGSDKPLIDTAALRNSISYVVTKDLS